MALPIDQAHNEAKSELNPLEERAVGKGLANALHYFGRRGMLGNDNYSKAGASFSKNEVIVGRQKDKTLDQQLQSLGAGTDDDRVKL